MEAPLEIRYAGVVIGRAQEVRQQEVRPDVPQDEGAAQSFFIPARDPMPVGTVLRVRSGDRETPVRVVRAIETTDAAACGMHVRTIGEAEEVAREFIPPPAVVAEKQQPATPTPTVEVDPSKTRDDIPAVDIAPAAAPKPTASATQEPASVQTEAAVVAQAKPEMTSTAVEAPPPVEPAPVQTAPSPSAEIAAVPDAVPVAVGSSMTGALRNATESVAVSEPASHASATQDGEARDPASPQAAVAGPVNATREYGVAVEDGSMPSGPTALEDLPPARPIAGPSGRRKTKRRK